MAIYSNQMETNYIRWIFAHIMNRENMNSHIFYYIFLVLCSFLCDKRLAVAMCSEENKKSIQFGYGSFICICNNARDSFATICDVLFSFSIFFFLCLQWWKVFSRHLVQFIIHLILYIILLYIVFRLLIWDILSHLFFSTSRFWMSNHQLLD